MPFRQEQLSATMAAIGDHTRRLTERALESLSEIPGLTFYGPAAFRDRAPLVAFNVAGHSPFDLAESLNDAGVESRAGCHCATLAHRDLGLDPAASCRLSFYLYNSTDDVDQAVAALQRIVTGPRTGRHRARDAEASSTTPVAALGGAPRHHHPLDDGRSRKAESVGARTSFALTGG